MKISHTREREQAREREKVLSDIISNHPQLEAGAPGCGGTPIEFTISNTSSSWLLMIKELHLTWTKRNIEVMATRFLQKWAGLARPGNTSLLYKSLLRVNDSPCLTRMSVLYLKNTSQRKLSRKLGVFERDIMVEDPGRLK